MPTRHETGLRINPSKTPNYEQIQTQSGVVISEFGIAYGFSGILEYEYIAAEDGSDGNLEFHCCEVLSRARPVVSEVRVFKAHPI